MVKAKGPILVRGAEKAFAFLFDGFSGSPHVTPRNVKFGFWNRLSPGINKIRDETDSRNSVGHLHSLTSVHLSWCVFKDSFSGHLNADTLQTSRRSPRKPQRRKSPSLSVPRSLRARKSSVLPTSMPLSTTLSSTLPILLVAKPFTASLVCLALADRRTI